MLGQSFGLLLGSKARTLHAAATATPRFMISLAGLLVCTALGGCLLGDDSSSSDSGGSTAAVNTASSTQSAASAAANSSGSSTGSASNAGGSSSSTPVNLNPGNSATLTGGTFKPSYALPGPGAAVSIGANNAMDIKPAEISATTWNYAVFGSFGGGTFVNDFSPGGAYVVAGTGGHGAPPNPGAAVFDFTDATWKRIDNANGIRYQLSDYVESQTTGAPYFELTGASAGQIPAPAHTYRTAVELPARLGGGSRGSLLLVTRTAIARESKVSGAVHRFDLSSGLWTRHIDAVSPEKVNYEGTSIFDAAEDKYWTIPDWLDTIKTVTYLDARSWTWKQTPEFPISSAIAYEPAYGATFLEEANRLLVYHRGSRMVGLDLRNPAAGWKVLQLSQSAPPGGDRWVYYPPDGSYYWRGEATGQTLYRLIPPTKDALNSTWNIKTVTISGATLPNFAGNSVRHYSSLFYVPSLQMLAWVAGGSHPVILIRPS